MPEVAPYSIQHHGDMNSPALEFPQKTIDFFSLGNEKRFSGELGDRGGLAADQGSQNILGVENPHHIVDGFAIHGNPGMARLDEDSERLLSGGILGNKDRVGPGHHHFLDGGLREMFDAFYHFLAFEYRRLLRLVAFSLRFSE
jgi:hypothetical protein